MIVRVCIGEDPHPPDDAFQVMDSKDASALIEEAMATSEVGETLHVIATAIEEGP